MADTNPRPKPYGQMPSIYYQALGLAYERDELLMTLLKHLKGNLDAPECLAGKTELTVPSIDADTARQMLADIETLDGLLRSALKECQAAIVDLAIRDALGP